MPKTLAALPSNQYATIFRLLFGKKLLFLTSVAAFWTGLVPIDLLKAPSGVWAGFAVDCHRTAPRMGLWRRWERSGGGTADFAGLTARLQAKKSRERRGAARLKAGKAWKIEAMAGGRRGGVAKSHLKLRWFDSSEAVQPPARASSGQSARGIANGRRTRQAYGWIARMSGQLPATSSLRSPASHDMLGLQ